MMRDSGVRLAELVATLSLASDLGLGQPAEHAIRSALVALDLADGIGLSAQDRATTYWVTLLAWVGCTADSFELARLFGDDIEFRAGTYGIDFVGVPQLAYLLRHAGSGGSLTGRATSSAKLLLSHGRTVVNALTAHCEATRGLAARFGLGGEIDRCLGLTFTRWDGRGQPRGVAGEDIPIAVRLLHLADAAVAHHRTGGTAGAVEVARKRRGTQLQPDLVDAFVPRAATVLAHLDEASSWGELVAAEPSLRGTLSDDELNAALEVLADFADLKSPWCLGHSRGVADLAAEAASAAGCSPSDVRLVHRAGLVHDLGRTGVPNTLWDKPGPLTPTEMERVRLHDYYTQRMLQHPAALAEIGAVASTTHERLDGSGYHRGAMAGGVSSLARLLAAADVLHAMSEDRPHRPALEPRARVAQLRAEARAGRLDTNAVDAVLQVTGHARRRRPAGPSGLTPREVEVLVHAARGASNRAIGEALGISAKTAGTHIEHIYLKLGVSTRAGAALCAIEHGLLPAASTAPTPRRNSRS
ncbi:MAG: HD domain-containing phosphohydrolase [Acidimicrobiales bacterium]